MIAAISAMASFGLALSATVWAAESPTLGLDTRLPVDVELVLAVDVSGSIDPAEARLQRDGYVAALSSPMLAEAVRRGGYGRIAVLYLEWSGQRQQQVLVDWTLIEDVAAAQAFAAAVAAQPVVVDKDRRTSLSGAMTFSAKLFDSNGFAGTRLVIDISGDGRNNAGHVVSMIRDRAVGAGITINGLPIVNARRNPSGGPPAADLEQYYWDCVVGGPGSFAVVADGYAAFGPAILKKLILEVAGEFAPTRSTVGDVRGLGPLLMLAKATQTRCWHTL